MLRCLEVGLSIRDLDLLTVGMVIDIWTEMANDRADSADSSTGGGGGSSVRMATQEDFDRF
jgi:hypothetical protein